VALFVFYFTRIRVAGLYSGLYSCMSRRGEEEKRRASSVFLLVRSGWTVFNCRVFRFLAWRNSWLPVGDCGGF